MSAFRLHLLRHGAPEVPGLLLGRTDAAPTGAGVAACGRAVAGLSFDHLVCSDLARARVAARAIGAGRGLAPRIDPRWREMDFGAWDGLSPEAVPPASLSAFQTDPDASPPPEGERWSALVARVRAALAEGATGDTLIVTHAGAMRAALTVLCGFSYDQVWAFDLPYASLLSLRVWPGNPMPENPMMAQITGLCAGDPT